MMLLLQGRHYRYAAFAVVILAACVSVLAQDAAEPTTQPAVSKSNIMDAAKAFGELLQATAPHPESPVIPETHPDNSTVENTEAKPASNPVNGGEPELTVSKDNRFTGYYQGTDLRVVLRQLSHIARKNIVATKEVSGSVTATLYDVTFEEALDAVLRSCGDMKYRQEGNFIYVYTAKQMQELLKSERKKVSRTFYLSYITADDAETLIKSALSDDGSISKTPAAGSGIDSSGSSSSSSDSGGNSYATSDMLVIRDYEENIKDIERLITELDVKPDQVLIEASILTATLKENNALGVNFTALSNNATFNALGYTTSDGYGSVTPGTAQNVNPTAGAVSTSFPLNPITGGLEVSILTDRLGLFIQALETVSDVNLLANPKLMVINKQKGEVLIGRRDGYRTTVVNQGISTESVEFLETGTKLIVRPYIARDGFIRMEVHPEDSDGLVTNNLPQETTTSVTSNVLVRDGRTLVIGGLFRERTTNEKSQIPVVGNIPLLGDLFKSTNDETDRQEVIILLTPHIVQQDMAEAVSQHIKDDVNRNLIGARKGLKWWSSQRLANHYVNKAREALNTGDMEKARWNIDAALNISPRMMEAVELREKLTGKAYWNDESRVSTINFTIERMLMHEMGKEYKDVIYNKKPLQADKVDEDVRNRFGITAPADKRAITE